MRVRAYMCVGVRAFVLSCNTNNVSYMSLYMTFSNNLFQSMGIMIHQCITEGPQLTNYYIDKYSFVATITKLPEKYATSLTIT